jgi:hypothetical protein
VNTFNKNIEYENLSEIYQGCILETILQNKTPTKKLQQSNTDGSDSDDNDEGKHKEEKRRR